MDRIIDDSDTKGNCLLEKWLLPEEQIFPFRELQTIHILLMGRRMAAPNEYM